MIDPFCVYHINSTSYAIALWMAAFLLTANANIDLLPVIEPEIAPEETPPAEATENSE
jgi:hypothetical protein